MDTFLEFLKNPFAWGLAIGLALTFFTWKSAMAAKMNLKKENKRLQSEMRELETHLNTQLKINASGNNTIQEKVDTLQEQNETLRVNLAALQNKPGRSELRSLHTMETAVRLMREQAPGFASAWEVALRQAENEYDEAAGGLRKLVRKVIALPSPSESSDSDSKRDDD
jgi:DNA-directed RNA polymerase subunit F